MTSENNLNWLKTAENARTGPSLARFIVAIEDLHNFNFSGKIYYQIKVSIIYVVAMATRRPSQPRLKHKISLDEF